MVTRRGAVGEGGGEGEGASDGGSGRGGVGATTTPTTTTKQVGDAAEARALAWLLAEGKAQGLTLVQRNYRVARGPAAHGGEIDLILRERDGTLVFVEVRARRSQAQGGAAASVGHAKQQRLVRAAQHYLQRFAAPPPCRFDVLAIDGAQMHWLRAAFDAG